MNAPERLERASHHLRARALWAALFVLAGLVCVAIAPSPPPATADGVAAMLGAAVGGEVRTDDFVWEGRGGFLRDAFFGRNVLFLARRAGSAADLYRARVRVSRAGHPLGVGAVRNLTASPIGDDRDLVASGHRAAYVTTAFGGVQGITLLDLDGEGDGREARGRLERALSAIESWIATGSTRGVGRTEITFGSPPPAARHELQGDLLVMALGKEGAPAALGTSDGVLNTGPTNVYEAVANRIPHRAPAPGDVLVEVAEELAGDAGASGARIVVDAVRSIAARVRHQPRVAPPLPEGSPVATSDDGWPPAPLPPPIQPAAQGEGVWVAGRVPVAGDAVPSVVQAAIRPDPAHPETWVALVAMDTRQLDLQLVAGIDEPRSETGLHGTGRLHDAALEERVIAAFAGGPAVRDRSAEPGFVADHRVLVPPRQGLATVAIANDGRAELGAWSGGDALPPAFASLRQMPDAILGGASPRWPLPGARDRIERSALGLTRTGQLVYAWSAGATADALARALALAGCELAVPLANGPAPAGFAYVRPSPGEAAPGMSLGPVRLAEPSRGDLFVVVQRASKPPPLASGTWAPDGGRQPSPAWLPAIQAASVASLGAQVHLTSFAPGRLSFRIRPGAKEPATKAVTALPTALPEAERPGLLAAIGLASGKRRGARGLIVDGNAALPFRSDDAGALVVEGGRPRILKASEASHLAGDATELPLTADEGKLRPEAREVGTMRARAAACALEDGTFVVASTTFDSDEATTSALLDLGCARVVALDRGSHQAAFLQRTGTGSAPEPRYDASVLYAVEVPFSGRAVPLAR